MKLNLTPNIDDADGFYEELLAAHEGLSKQESDVLNAQIILILANHIGDREILGAAIQLAAQSLSDTKMAKG